MVQREVYAMSRCGHRVVIPYRLPLRRPWRTASGVRTERRGWLVRLDSSDDLCGWGDCAPLEEAGTESWRHAAALLQYAVQALGDSGVDDVASLLPDDAPAVRCALEVALLDLSARVRDCSVARFVLKPMAHGGLRSVLDLARRAETVGIESVITTSVESAVGVAACLHLAAALNNGLAHGLATSEWLKSDVAVPIPIAKGRMRVPVASGLGVEPRKEG